MLLKLIPAKHEPTIHFSLSFADLPSNLPTPPSWTAQLSHLMHEDLEVPATLHSLDRAAGVSSLLEEVTLDVEAKEVKCLFIDGAIERISFGLGGQRSEQMLMDAVVSIINDVKESTMEDRRVTRQREWERQRARSASVVTAPVSPPKSGRQGKHKKQRSLFMHIVSSIGSIINLTTPSSSNPALPFHYRSNPSGYRNSNIPSPTMSDATSLSSPPLPTPGSSPRARTLRRAARSALVDTYRRFVLGELVRRFYAGPEASGVEYPSVYGLESHHQRERGGFCVWILHSMRRRAFIRMEQLLAEAGPPPNEIVRFSEESMPGVCPTTMDVPLSFSDEEDDDPPAESPVAMHSSENASRPSSDAMDMDADDLPSKMAQRHPPRPSVFPRRASSSASVSTNDSSESGSTTRSSSSLSCTSTAPSSMDSEPELKEENSPIGELPLTLHQSRYSSHSGPTIDHLSPAARHEYTQLSALRTRLNQLVQFAASQSRVATDEVRSRLEVLAVRSRRRAWLNKALKGPLVKPGGVGAGGSMFGLATPFRSSPLARYMVTADDLARRMSSISRSTCSSTSSLSSAYFRSVSSASSSSSSISPSPPSSLSKASITPFPSSRPRIRPKMDYGAALAAAVVEYADSPDAQASAGANDTAVASSGDEDRLIVTTMEEMEDETEDRPVEQEFEMYQEVKGPSQARRHRRSMQETMLPVAPLVASRVSGGRLFPVNEELENENDEFTLALSARGRGRPRRKGAFISTSEQMATFMGCDEAHIDDDDEEEYADKEESEYESPESGDGAPDLELGLGSDIDMDSTADGLVADAERPQIQPRVRTSSMVGALLRGAKGVQRSLAGSLKPQAVALTTDSLLYQPVAAGHPHHQPHVPSKITTLPSPVHASNRRAMDLSRPPVSTAYRSVDVEMGSAEMNVQLRIDEFDNRVGSPLPSAKAGSPPIAVGIPSEFEIELQQYHAQEQEFTLAMDVPRAGGGGKRWRNSPYPVQHDAARRPKLSNIFADGQIPSNSPC